MVWRHNSYLLFHTAFSIGTSLSPSLYSALSIIINCPFSFLCPQMMFDSFSSNNKISQYLCLKCNTVLRGIVELKEGKVECTAISYFSKKEQCPKCGSLLANSLLKRRRQCKEIQNSNIYYNNTIAEQRQQQEQSQPLSLISKFHTAYDRLDVNNRLTLDIKSVDLSLIYFTTGESVCIMGKPQFTNLLLSRLCIRALMPKRYIGCLDSGHVIFIDAGGYNSDPYQCVNFARQYGLDIKKVLQSIIVCRAFTIYQLANLIIYELPKVIRQFDNVKLIIIADLLGMFVKDPQIEIKEGEFIIEEIITSIRRQSSLSDRLFIVSLNVQGNDNNNSHKFANYYKCITRRFSKCIKISRDNLSSNGNNLIMIELGVRNQHNSHQYQHHHPHAYNKFLIKERNLRII